MTQLQDSHGVCSIVCRRISYDRKTIGDSWTEGAGKEVFDEGRSQHRQSEVAGMNKNIWVSGLFGPDKG
jgi:hypothetical protein